MATIVVTGRDAEVTSRNKQRAEEKLAKLERYFDGITRIEAILAHQADAAEVELVISVRRGRPIVCHGSAKELYAALDGVIDKAEIQLTRFKERAKAHRAEPTGMAAAEPESLPEEPLESYDEIVDRTGYSSE